MLLRNRVVLNLPIGLEVIASQCHGGPVAPKADCCRIAGHTGLWFHQPVPTEPNDYGLKWPASRMRKHRSNYSRNSQLLFSKTKILKKPTTVNAAGLILSLEDQLAFFRLIRFEVKRLAVGRDFQ